MGVAFAAMSVTAFARKNKKRLHLPPDNVTVLSTHPRKVIEQLTGMKTVAGEYSPISETFSVYRDLRELPEGEYTAALEYKDKGMANDEERAYKRCLKYDPKFPQCHFGLFEIFKGRADEKNATSACKNFLKFANETDFKQQVATCQQYVRD